MVVNPYEADEGLGEVLESCLDAGLDPLVEAVEYLFENPDKFESGEVPMGNMGFSKRSEAHFHIGVLAGVIYEQTYPADEDAEWREEFDG